MVTLKNKFNIKAIKFDGTNHEEIEDFIRSIGKNTIYSFDFYDSNEIFISLFKKTLIIKKNQYLVCYRDEGKYTSDHSFYVEDEEYIKENYNIVK